MSTEIISKHGLVAKSPFELYMAFVDMRNFLQMLPEDKRQGVVADYDTITAEVQGFKIGLMVKDRIPYSRIEFIDSGAPFSFGGSLHFDASSEEPSKTDFHIEFQADLNLMMKMMLSGKIKEALDRLTKDKTTFIVAHRLSTIKNADKILYIGNMGILESGTHEELMKKKGYYYELTSINVG